MFVSPAAQGRGAGRTLAIELIRAARAEAYTSMYLETAAVFGTVALRAYRRL